MPNAPKSFDDTFDESVVTPDLSGNVAYMVSLPDAIGEDASTMGVGFTGTTVVVTACYTGVCYAAAIDTNDHWSDSVVKTGVICMANAVKEKSEDATVETGTAEGPDAASETLGVKVVPYITSEATNNGGKTVTSGTLFVFT